MGHAEKRKLGLGGGTKAARPVAILQPAATPAPVVPVEPAAPDPETSPQAPATVATSAPASDPSSRDSSGAERKPSSRRTGTRAAPHVRQDGIKTVATTIHMPEELRTRLRVMSAESGKSMSEIVVSIVTAKLK